jgi:hypothetical protein
MRNLFFFVLVVFIASCTQQKAVSLDAVSDSGEVKKKGMKMYGKIVVQSVVKDGLEMPVLYFERDGVAFFINIPLGKVSKSEIQKHVYKDIDVVGEIKNGPLSSSFSKTRSGNENQQQAEGPYVILYKILD